MPMLFQPTTSLADLSRMNDIPVDMTLEGLNQYRQGQQADQMAMDDLPGLIQHQQNMRPLQEQSLAANNTATLAQIPGMQADARMKNVQADTAEKTQQSNIEALIAKHGHEKMKAYAEDMQSLGPLMQQAGIMAASGPGGLQRARKMLEDSGHGDMWDDMYDRAGPSQASKVLWDRGRQIVETLPKYQQAIDTAALKAEYQARLEQSKIESRERISASRNQTMRDINNEVLATKRALDKPDLEQLAGRMAQLAYQAQQDGNQEQYATFKQRADQYLAAANQLKISAATIGNEAKIDAAKLINEGKFEMVNPQKTGATAVSPVAGGNQPAQPKSAQEAQAAGWKLHQDANGNKAYVSPDGKSYFEAK